MNRIIVAIALALVATNINAQLVVDSLGRVGIGTETPLSTLSVGDDGNDDAAISCTALGKTYGIRMINYANVSDARYGIYSHFRNIIGNSYAGKFVAIGGDDMNSSQCAIGMTGLAYRANTAIGILGGKQGGTSSYYNYAGVYGTDTGSLPVFSYGIYNFSGVYAGYFRGTVRVTNGLYATLLSPTTNASSSGQVGITTLSDRDESVTDKLSQVQAVQFLRYDPARESNTNKNSVEDIDTDIDNMSPEELDSLTEKMGHIESESYLSPIQYGLDSDQLKAVFPELVYEDANGNVSINYVEMVPLLVQSINELKAELAELKGTSAKKAKAETTGIDKTVPDVDMVRMDQNKPNPFNESTVITLNIPSNAQTANIYIYDMSGKQVQSLPVSERGETNITVYTCDLSAGMYIYTLVIDGKVSVTRRMVVE